MNKKERVNHAEYLLSECIEKAVEEGYDEVEMPMSVALLLQDLLNSQAISEPLTDVIFFAGKPTERTMVYHALVRPETVDMMRADPNIGFCLLKNFNGHFEANTPATLGEQEDKTRCELEGRPSNV